MTPSLDSVTEVDQPADSGRAKELRFAGLPFRGLRKSEILDPANWPMQVITVNAEMIVRANEGDDRLRGIIGRETATFDGQVPYVLARRRHPEEVFEKIAGSDLIFDLVRLSAEKGLKLFFLGGKESALKGAVRVAKEGGAVVEGYSPPFCDYPFPVEHNERIMARIDAARPEILLVGFGAGKQEYWAEDFRERLRAGGVKLVIGVGGSFEFLSGEIKRAPVWAQKLGLEGVYRLLRERKLFRVKRLLLSFRVFRYAKR